jgi:TolA-binding protein
MNSMRRTALLAALLPWLLLLCRTPADAQSSKENADFKLALNLYRDGLHDLAAEQLRQFLAAYPLSAQAAEARFTLGLAQLQLRRYDDARITFQTFAITYQDNPRAPEAWWKVGEAFAAQGNHREAALAFERVKTFHPRSSGAADALARAGREFLLAGMPDDARRVLRIVLQEYGSSGAALTARTQLGDLYVAEGKLEEARVELLRVVEGDPSPVARSQALLSLGAVEQQLGQTDRAAGRYREITTRQPGSAAAAAAFLALGRIEAAAGRPQQAIEQYRKVLDARAVADSAVIRDALIGAGDAYMTLKDFAGAGRNYNLYLSSFPGDTLQTAVLWKNARAAAGARNYSRSTELCTRILAAPAPAVLHRRARMRIALNAEAQGNHAQAVQLFEQYASANPDDPVSPAVLLRAARRAHEQLTDPRTALDLLELIGSRHATAPEADDALAEASAIAGEMRETDDAVRAARQLITRFPGSDHRIAADARLRRIELYEARNKDAGLEKLALLIGDVVAERDRDGLAFRLGEVYFHDLKNYAAAAQQFGNAIASGMQDSRFVDALYLRARSLELLAATDPAHTERAVEAYTIFLSSFPEDPRAPEAAVARFLLEPGDAAAAAAAADTLLASPSGSAGGDRVLDRVAGLRLAAGDTTGALTTLARLRTEHPASPFAPGAALTMLTLLRTGGRPDSALTLARSVLEDAPVSPALPPMLAAAGEMLMDGGRPAEAVPFYRRLTSEFPYTSSAADARRNLAHALTAAGNGAEAVPLFRALLQAEIANPLGDGTPDPDLVLGLAQALTATGERTEARTLLRELVGRDPAGAAASGAFTLLGIIARADGSQDLAAAYFAQASAGEGPVRASPDIADLLFESGRFPEALRQYTALAEGAAGDLRRRYDARIILCRIHTGDPRALEEQIRAFARTYRNTDEELASFELERGNALFARQDYANAAKAYSRVLDDYDETASAPAAMYWSAKILESSGKVPEAQKQYERLLKEYPGAAVLPRAHLALGNIAYNAERWDAATRYYRLVVDDPRPDPEILPFAMNNLIETYETAGVYDAALALTRRYLEQYPNAEDSFNKKIKIGVLYQRLGYHEQSVLHLTSLLDQAGSDLEGEIRYTIGEAHYGKGDYQQAILEFLKVPYLVTNKGKIDWTANALYMSGQSYEKMGRHDQALTMYQQIVDRPGIDATFKAAARKEIDRVRTVLNTTPKE